MGWTLPGVLRWLPVPTITPRQQVVRTLETLASGARIIDIGAGGRRINPQVMTFDMFPGPDVDFVGDIHCMPIENESFDCVICTGTLEHVRDPWQAVREIFRILKPGGIVHIDVPFIQGYHADPTDYWRFTLDGLKLLCQCFQEIESGVHIGPSCGLVWVLREWADSSCSNPYLGNLFLILAAILSAPVKYLDYFIIDKPRSHRVASALYFRGQKPFQLPTESPKTA